MIPLEPQRHGKLTGIYNEPMSWTEAFTWIGLAALYWAIAGAIIYLLINAY